MAAPGRHLPPLPTMKEIVRLYRLRARKQLSQNFLMDMNLTEKIVKAAGNINGFSVIEVGPGPGGITRSVLNSGAGEVVVIEKDSRFLPSLQVLANATNKKMRIFHGDVLNFNVENMFPEEMKQEWTDQNPKIHIIGNLPFNISSPLIIKYFRQISERSGPWSYGRVRMTLTFQREVAERLVAPVLHPDRCRLSVMCQNVCYAWHKFDIPGNCFVPKPDVDVSVVTFSPLKKKGIDVPFSIVEKVVRHTFQFRRRHIKTGLETLFPPDKPYLKDEFWSKCNLDPTLRPYQLSVEDFNQLCKIYKDVCESNPGVLDYNFRSKEEALKWKLRKKLYQPLEH